MIVAMPVFAMGGYFTDADEEFYETIEEAVVYCLKREMVGKYQVDGQLIWGVITLFSGVKMKKD